MNNQVLLLMRIRLTPVTAVPVQVQAKGSRYQGDFEMKNNPTAYEETDIKTDFHAFTSSISNTFK
jgi:hypothetical protein